VKHLPAQPLLNAKRLQRDARTEAARAGRAQSDPQRVRLDADRRRIQASRDVMTVLDMLEASSSAARVESRAVADRPGKEPGECGRVLVVLFVHNIWPVDSR
jgi:hypothetical protein